MKGLPHRWSIRRKMVLRSALLAGGFVGCVWLMMTVDNRLGWLVLLLGAVDQWFTRHLRCPTCRTSVFRAHVRIFGVRFNGRKDGLLFFPRACSHCGADFTQPAALRTNTHHHGRRTPMRGRAPVEGWQAASARQKRLLLGAGLGVTLLGDAIAYYHGQDVLLVWGLVGSAIVLGLLLAVRDE